MAEYFDHNPYFLSVGALTPDVFSVLGFETTFLEFNHDYRCTVWFALRKSVTFGHFLRKPVCLQWSENQISGVVESMTAENIVIASPLFLLHQTKHSKLYADKNISQLIIEVLKSYDLSCSFLLKSNYPVLAYVAQYHETDLEFIQRQCSKWGIFFGIHKNKIIFCDNSEAYTKQFFELDRNLENFSEFQKIRTVLPRTVKINDYNPEAPDISLEMEAIAYSAVTAYGVDNRPYEFYQTRELGQFILKKRMDYYDARREIISASIGNIDLQLGQCIRVEDEKYYIIEIIYNVSIRKNTTLSKVTLIKAKEGEKQLNYCPELPKLFHMPDVTAHIISDNVDAAGRYYISPDYDETQAVNTYPVRLVQPSTGNNIGYHFPLINNTKVWITHINGDPDRPIILGVYPDSERPSLVSVTNQTQHILQTPIGNQWLMDDDGTQSVYKFASANNSELQFEPNHLMLMSPQDVVLNANKNIIHNNQGRFVQRVDKTYILTVGQDHQINAKNNIGYSSGNNNIFSAESAELNSKSNTIISSDSRIEFTGNKITIQANTLAIRANHGIDITAPTLIVKSNQSIRLMVGNSSLIINEAGITVNANSVSFNTPSFNSPPPQLGTSYTETFRDNLHLPQFTMQYENLDNRVALATFEKKREIVYATSVRELNSIKNIDDSAEIRVAHAGLPVISVDDKSQPPAHYFKFKPVLHKNYKIKLLKKPIYKKIHKTDNYFNCELLTPSEIAYFKTECHNNVILFVHGYDVEDGYFGEFDYIRTPQEGFPDEEINGTGAHNWLLHMEYNLNCAKQNTYLQFPWKNHALHYKRIIGIHWPGYQKIWNIPYSDDLNFAGMEFNAIGSGYALVEFIHQLKSQDLKVYLIAHSLGCLTAIQLMDLLGRTSQCPIEQTIFWQPAIASTALSPVIIQSQEQRRSAVKKTLGGEVGSLSIPPLMPYEYYGEQLRQKAAKFKHIPPWDLYEKDPFAYFPYAHIASKKIHVLSSHYDHTLKMAYELNAVFANLPHLNFIHEAMGLAGPDDSTLKLLQGKLRHTDQRDWLSGHSAMKIPSKVLFEQVYRLIIQELGGL